MFKLPHRVPVDQKALKAAYFDLQKNLHPDQNTSNKTAITSAQINAFYQDLKSLSKSAKHLLALQKIDLSHEVQNQDLLFEVMLWEERFQLASLEEKEELINQVIQKITELVDAFTSAYEAHIIDGKKEESLQSLWQSLRYYEQLLTRHKTGYSHASAN